MGPLDKREEHLRHPDAQDFGAMMQRQENTARPLGDNTCAETRVAAWPSPTARPARQTDENGEIVWRPQILGRNNREY